ncbi:MAG: permease prefix domain 1-containing protein [Candidatus Nanopelagicales bacterium]
MTDLVERYIAATAQELPRAQRQDITNELRETMLDDVEAKVDQGLTRAQAEEEVVTAMGDPIRLAAKYSGRQLTLIDSRLYPAWRRILVTVLWITIPIVAIATGASSALGDTSVWSAIGQALMVAFMSAIQIAFWITLVFALIQRFAKPNHDDSELGDMGQDWTPADLPEPISPKQGLGDLAAEIVASIIGIAFLIYQASWLTVDGIKTPILNPEVTWWLVLMIITLAASAALAIWIGTKQDLQPVHARWNLYLAIIAVVPTVYLALSNQLLNPAFVDHFTWLDSNLQTVNILIAIGVVVAWGYDVIEKTIKASRRQV